MAFHELVDSVESFEKALKKVKEAQEIFSTYTQEQVDAIFFAAASAANKQRIPLAKMAVEETGYGIVEDKVIKNNYAAEHIYNAYKHTKTCGVIERDEAYGIEKIAEPIGVVGAVIPTTNPTSTAIFKTLISLKTRNGIIISPHPRAKKCTVEAAKIVYEAAVKAGAPDGIISWVDVPSLDLTNLLMKEVDIILATGGPGMVKAAYSSGKPAFGVGQGNVQEIVDLGISDAELERQATLCVAHRAKDNGVPCAGAQTVHIHAQQLEQWKGYMQEHGAFLIDKDEDIAALRALVFPDGGTKLNRAVVGKFPYQVGEMCGLNIPETAKIMLVKNQAWGEAEVLCREILFPIVRYTVYEKFEDAVDRAVANLEVEGAGHTSTLWTTNDDHVEYAAKRIPVGRFHINQPTMGGRIPIITSITIGCGTWGGNSGSDNLNYTHLLNKTRIIRTLEHYTEKDIDEIFLD